MAHPHPHRHRPSRPSVLARLAGRLRQDDDGIALIVVIGTMALVTVLALGALTLVLRSTPAARASEDATTALAAAQAGVDDYVSRLNANDAYWTSGNTDSSNAALVTTGLGRTVPGTGGTGASYRYQLLNTPADIAAGGTIQLQVTGTSTAPSGAAEQRTLIATLTTRGFLRYIYFSDVEAVDPALWQNAALARCDSACTSALGGAYVLASPARALTDCSSQYQAGRAGKHYTAGSNGDTATVVDGTGAKVGEVPGYNGITSATISGYCANHDIVWVSGDVVRGPLHSNDALQLNGSPRFGDPATTTAWDGVDGRYYYGWGSPSRGTAASPGYLPQHATALDLPLGNSELLKYVEPRVDSSSNTDRPGCLYRGATRITFTGTTMSVWSPQTTDAPSRCLDTTRASQEQGGLRIPPVIHVAASTGACPDAGSGVGYPLAGEVALGASPSYSCTNGSAYVSGQVGTQVTVSTANDVVLVGDTTYSDGGSGTNVLGLVANSSVWVHHPVDAGGANLRSTPVSTVSAAVLSLQHSFLVQNWDRGSNLGTLHLQGALAQKFRGPVGQGSSGYTKDYRYDTRLNNLQPPYFLKPVAASWAVTSVVDAPSQG